MNHKTKDLSVQIKCRLPIAEVKISLSTNFTKALHKVLQSAFPFDISEPKLAWYGNTANITGSMDNCSIVGTITVVYPSISITIKIPTSLTEMINLETVSEDLRTRVEEIFPKLPQ